MLTVNLKENAYPIYLGNDLLKQPQLFSSHIQGQQILIVTQERIAELHLEYLENTLSSYSYKIFHLPDGEQYKNIIEWQKIIDFLIKNEFDRGVTLIALGGGIVGDMTGFAAACYQRGVKYIQIPTTLIAQVDASIGGKTGINHASRKNIVGAFYQPECVIIDTNFLNTLPQREFISGMAEIIKCALIWDADFFFWLVQQVDLLLAKDICALQYAIEKSISIKAEIVVQDERDQGLRQLLNFGHTFGHALESVTQFQKFLHGEAVAIGMMMAANFSVDQGLISVEIAETIKKVLVKFGLPVDDSACLESLDFLRYDKKVKNGKLNLILLEKIGKAVHFAANSKKPSLKKRVGARTYPAVSL